MPAKPKIYERRDRPGSWCVRIAGKRTLLSRESYADACRQYAILVGGEAPARHVAIPEAEGRVTIVEVVDRYLASLLDSGAKKTVAFNRHWLKSFVDFVGPRTPVDAIEPHRIDDWIRVNRQRWNGTSANHAISSLSSAIAWAGRKRYYKGENPAAFADRPSRERSPTIALTPDQQRQLVRVAPSLGRPFADAVTMMLLSGVRPQELRAIEVRHVDLSRSIIQWRSGDAPKGSAPRTVYLAGETSELVSRLMKDRPEGTLFRTSRGNPWTKDGLDTMFFRLRQILPIAGLNPRCLRKTFATNCAAAGLPREHTQELMGHSDHRMLDEVYLKLECRPEIHRSAAIVLGQHPGAISPNAQGRRRTGKNLS